MTEEVELESDIINKNVTVDFSEDYPWKSIYCRNNKIGGLKHVRCFPEHSSDGHRAIHYCGTSIDVVIKKSTMDNNKILVIGDFSQEKRPTFIIGDKTSKANINKYIQPEATRNSHCKYFAGMCKNRKRTDDLIIYSLNSERKGWHYGWTAKKNLPGIRHTFNVYLFVNIGSNQYQCVSMVRSPPFLIICRRREVRKHTFNDMIDLIDSYNPIPKPLPVLAIDPYTLKSSIIFKHLLIKGNEEAAKSEIELSQSLAFRPYN